MNSLPIVIPPPEEKGKGLVESSKAFAAEFTMTRARSPHEYRQCAQFVRDVKARFNQIEAMRVHLKEPALEAGRRVDELFGPTLKLLKQVESKAKGVLTDYEDEQERLAREEQRKAEEQARIDRERLEAAAIDTMDSDPELSQQLMQQSEQVVAPVITPDVPVIQGQSTREVWRHEVVDAKLVPREYLMVNEPMLSAIAKSTKEKHPEIPGVRFYPDKVKSVKA